MTKKSLRAGYFLNFWSLPNDRRLDWVCRTILLGLAAQMLLSWSVWWTPNGVLPYLPITSFLDPWLAKSSMILFPAFLLLLVVNLALKYKRVFLALLLLTGILLVVGNIHRLQVWFYFYGLILFLFLWESEVSDEIISGAIRGIIVGAYCWSGLHKFNIHFVEDIFPWLIEPLGWPIDSFPPSLAYLAGGVELLIGLGLLFQFTRKFSVVGCLLFHGIILGLLGPLGHNWNIVVWPWNLVMPILVFLLFFKTKKNGLRNSAKAIVSFPAGLLVLFFVWILPAFNYTGFTPEQLSFKMYAGSQPEMVLYFGAVDRHLLGEHPTIYSSLPPDTTPRHRVILDDVAFAEWGIPLFTTEWTAQLLKRQFCPILQRPQEAGILYLVNDDFIRIPCLREH